jgi:hypothetical protein
MHAPGAEPTQRSSVHASASSQVGGVPGPQPMPGVHTSGPLQKFVSAQKRSSAMTVHAPVAGVQPSTVQRIPSSQTVGVPFWHVPRGHASAPLHASPSSHSASVVQTVQPSSIPSQS